MSGSKRKPARKPASRPTWRRKRPHKIEIYVSDEELQRFEAKCAAKSRNYSEQIRFWINLEPRPRKASEPPQPDPRQTNITDALALNSETFESLRAFNEALRDEVTP